MTHFTHSHIDAIADAVIHSVCHAEVEAHLRAGVLAHSGQRSSRISHAVYFAVLFKRLAPYERRWKTMLWKIWAEEQAIILANLKKLKKAQRRKGFSDNVMYPQAPFKEKLSKETKKILTVMLADLGQEKLDDLDLGMAFDVTNPNVKRWLTDYSFKFSEELEAVNSERLRRILDEGMAAGKSIPELMAEVKKCFDSMDRYRAEIISRTETSRASNKAAMEAYRQSGVVEKKQWLTAPDCCEICAELDGKIVALDDTFFDDDYGDGAEPPRHVSCRCSIAPIVE